MRNMENKTLNLTENERIILELLKQGLEDKEIAEKLAINRHTVKSHKNKLILLKLI